MDRLEIQNLEKKINQLKIKINIVKKNIEDILETSSNINHKQVENFEIEYKNLIKNLKKSSNKLIKLYQNNNIIKNHEKYNIEDQYNTRLFLSPAKKKSSPDVLKLAL